MHAVIKKLIAVMQQGSSGVFVLHDESRVKFSKVVSITGDDNLIDYFDGDGNKQQTQLGVLVAIEAQ